MRCPAAKFITHTLSHFCFLFLLAAATFRLDDRSHVITSTPRLFNRTYDDDDRLRQDVDNTLKDTFRPANVLFTHVQICLMFWVFGMNTTTYAYHKPSTHRRRRRGSTRQLLRVCVGGVYWALTASPAAEPMRQGRG